MITIRENILIVEMFIEYIKMENPELAIALEQKLNDYESTLNENE